MLNILLVNVVKLRFQKWRQKQLRTNLRQYNFKVKKKHLKDPLPLILLDFKKELEH